jgi:hypothetical protein
MYFKSSLICLYSCINLSAVIHYEANSNKVPGYLLCRKCKTLTAIILQKLLSGIIRTTDNKRTPVKTYKPQVVKPATAILRIKALGTFNYI